MTELLKKYQAYYKREISTEEFEKYNTLAYNAYSKSAKIAERWKEYHMILDGLYQEGYQNIVNCVKELGIMNFYITDGFSGLIERLGTLPEYCTVKGVCKICVGTKYNLETDEDEPEYGYALHIYIENE